MSFDGGKHLSNHIKRVHQLSGEEYTIKHFHGGARPTCRACGKTTRYVSFSFKEYCGSCAPIAMREGGAKGGKAEAWNRGMTARDDERIRAAAVRMTGSGNPFYGKRHNDLVRSRISISKRLRAETVDSRILSRWEEFEMVTPLEDYTSRQRQYLQFRCKVCGTLQDKTLQAFERGSLCQTCHPISTSKWQLEVEEWVRSEGFEVKRGDRTTIHPREIDIFIPDHGVGIECHGLYFHSEAMEGCDKWSHSLKADLADAAGVRLLQVFHDEWRDRNHIVKEMILSRLGKASRRVGARKCEIVRLNTGEQRAFFESSHLSGYSPAQIAWGLRFGNEILSSISLRVPRQGKWKDYLEISRFATIPGASVPGALSRLCRIGLNYAMEQGKRGLMTYVDRRVGDGSGYRQSGFTEVGRTGPDYWYTDLHSRFDRFKFRARDGLSERDVALASKVVRIWGAGSRIMTMTR